MKYLFFLTLCAIFLFPANKSHADDQYNFKYIKPKGLLKERIKLIKAQQDEIDQQGEVSEGLVKKIAENEIKLNSIITKGDISINVGKKGARRSKDISIGNDNNIGNEDSTLFETIVSYLEPNYQNIGENQTNSILNYNSNFDLGKMNCSGFQWQKPMGSFSIGVDRQLAPDLFDDVRWIVTDRFTLYINAYTYLHNLDEAGIVDMTQSEIAAFAGVEFKREYRFVHFANSFSEGLTSDFTKLFFSFLKFRGEGLTELQPYEIVTKEDYIAVHAGAGGHIPITTGLSASGGVIVSLKNVSKVTVQSIGPEDDANPGEALRISFEKTKGKEIAAEANLELEFYQILKLTLLSYELSYEYNDIEKIYLTFFEKDLPLLKKNTPVGKDVRSLLKLHRPHLDNLHPFIVSRERRTQENLQSHYKILLYGSLKKYQTEQVKIEKNGIIKTFFRNRSENLKYIQGFLSTLLNSVTQALVQTSLFKKYKAFRSRKLLMEYNGQRNFTSDSDIFLDNEDKLSIKFDHEYMATKTRKRINKKYKKYALSFAKNYTSLPSSVIDMIEKNKLVGPMNFSVTARVNKNGLERFNSLPVEYIKDQTSSICEFNKNKYDNYKKKSKQGRWYKRLKYRFKLSKLKASKKYRCFKRLTNKYSKYIESYLAHRDMSLWKLKDFLLDINKYSKKKNDLRKLFGEDNVFFNGKFSAMTNDGFSFSTYFNEGKFNGLGVVDEYKRKNTLRTPASIISN